MFNSLKQFLGRLYTLRWLILPALLLTAVAYSLLTRAPKPQPKPTPTPTIVPAQSPPTPEVGSTPLPSSSLLALNYPLLGASLDSAGQTVYFLDPSDQHLRRINLQTKAAETLAKPEGFIERISWSPNHQKLILLTRATQFVPAGDESDKSDLQRPTTLLTYDLTTKRTATLNRNIKAISFLGSRKIIYQYRDKSENNLSIAKLDGSSWQNISRLTGEVAIVWAADTALVASSTSKEITRYDQSGKVVERFSAPADLSLEQSVWAGRGKEAVYWTIEGKEIVVKRLRPQGSEVITTIPEDDLTILWDNRTGDIYAAGFEGLKRIGNSP